ncbi:MAG: hypothetical protein IPH31_07285 [Lewinellaceae bacterium]|nr:hypothetical protein [Lewinellaceae bacterium]
MFSKISFLQCMMLMGIVLLSSCKKDSKDPDNVSDAEYYFYGKLDGQTNLLEIDATGDYQMSNSIDASIGVPFCTYSYGCAIGAFDPIDAPYFEVYFPICLTAIVRMWIKTFPGFSIPAPIHLAILLAKCLCGTGMEQNSGHLMQAVR